MQGFRKSDPDQWQFSNDRFIKGRRDLLKDIHRRKAVTGNCRDMGAMPGNAVIEVMLPIHTRDECVMQERVSVLWLCASR